MTLKALLLFLPLMVAPAQPFLFADRQGQPGPELEKTNNELSIDDFEESAVAVPDQLRADTCDYKGKWGDKHVMVLPPNPKCPKLTRKGVTAAEKQEILDAHNRLRKRVAEGKETLGYHGTSQPAATDLGDVTWNDDLAMLAQAWAEECVWGHDVRRLRRTCSYDKDVGQNAYSGFDSWTKAVEMWYNEVKNHPGSWAREFQGLYGPNGKAIGHYTQVVWAKSTEIGCGAIWWESQYEGYTQRNFFCNYGPGGNILYQPVYTVKG